jgi:uncharacterized protein GlcG (DUF336 family)
MSRKNVVKMLAGLLVGLSAFVSAKAQMPNPYGRAISLENAKKAAAPALAEAAKNNWRVAVAIVDPGGNLVYYEKMDNTQLGSAKVAIDKARSATMFKRPTKALQDALAAGGEGWRILAGRGRRAGGRWVSAGDGRKNRGRDRRQWRDERAGLAMRQSRRGYCEVSPADETA